MAPDKEIVGFDGCRDGFIGQYKSLNEPDVIVEEICIKLNGKEIEGNKTSLTSCENFNTVEVLIP